MVCLVYCGGTASFLYDGKPLIITSQHNIKHISVGLNIKTWTLKTIELLEEDLEYECYNFCHSWEWPKNSGAIKKRANRFIFIKHTHIPADYKIPYRLINKDRL